MCLSSDESASPTRPAHSHRIECAFTISRGAGDPRRIALSKANPDNHENGRDHHEPNDGEDIGVRVTPPAGRLS